MTEKINIPLQKVPTSENDEANAIWCPFTERDDSGYEGCMYDLCPAFIIADVTIEVPEKKSRIKLSEVSEPEKMKPPIELAGTAVRRGYCYRIFPFLPMKDDE